MTAPAAATRSVVIERVMSRPPEKIWRALTQGPLIEEWLMKNDFQPVVGHRFNFRATPMPHWNGVTDCQVLVVEPNERLSYSWNASGEEAAKGLKTGFPAALEFRELLSSHTDTYVAGPTTAAALVAAAGK